jgi:hypothetical protein
VSAPRRSVPVVLLALDLLMIAVLLAALGLIAAALGLPVVGRW